MPRAERRRLKQSRRTGLKKAVNCKDRSKVKSVQFQSWAFSFILKVETICKPSRESERGRTGQEGGSDRQTGIYRGWISFADVWCFTFTPHSSTTRYVNTSFWRVRTFHFFTMQSSHQWCLLVCYPPAKGMFSVQTAAIFQKIYFQYLFSYYNVWTA